jgi:hypothetical protein
MCGPAAFDFRSGQERRHQVACVASASAGRDCHFGGASFFFSGGDDWRRSQASSGTDRLVPQRLQTQMSTLPVRTANTNSFDKQTGQRGIISQGSGGSRFDITRQYQLFGEADLRETPEST